MITGFLQAQTLQNPNFGNTTTNTLKVKNSATVTSVNFLSTVESDGSIAKIDPVNLPINTATEELLNSLNLKLPDYNFLLKTKNSDLKPWKPLIKNPPILSAAQSTAATLPVFKAPNSGTDLSAFFSYYYGDVKRADFNRTAETYSGVFPDYQYVKDISVTTTNSFGNINVEFNFDGLAFELVEKGQAGRYQILVDEGDGYKAVTRLSQAGAPSTGSKYFRKVTFPDKRSRNIRVEYTGIYFGGVYVNTGDNVVPVVRPMGKKAVFLGDSFTEGTGGSGVMNSYGTVVANMLGLEAIQSGSGGTGYLNSGTAGRVKFQDRVARDVIYYNPDIVVIEGGQNDTTYDQSTLSTAVNLLITTVKTALPSAKIYVLSNFTIQGSSTAILNTRNTIKAAALSNSVFFIDAIDGVSYNESGVAIDQKRGSWITGSGSIDDIKQTGNASIYVASDKAHPNVAGHVYLGMRIANEMQRLSGVDFFTPVGTSSSIFPLFTLNTVLLNGNTSPLQFNLTDSGVTTTYSGLGVTVAQNPETTNIRKNLVSVTNVSTNAQTSMTSGNVNFQTGISSQTIKPYSGAGNTTDYVLPLKPSGAETFAMVSDLPTSGAYVPTGTAGTNITSPVNLVSHYTKIGNLVTVNTSIRVNVTSTATNSDFTITLPTSIVTAPTSGLLVGRGFSISNGNNTFASVKMVDSTHVKIEFVSTNALTNDFNLTFTYTNN